MLLALDAGNSNITIGAFEGSDLVCQWRLRTVHDQTADEWGILLRNLFSPAGLDIRRVDGIIISSVVPPIDSTLAFMTQRYFHTNAMFVGPHTDIGLEIRYDNPNEVGADRLVNGVAGFYKYGGPCVVVDMGTTINFDCISAAGEYLGGSIAVGIGISINALFSKTARLPKVDFRRPKNVIGTNTVASIQSGLYYGAIGMIDGILERVISQLGPETKAIATGGQAHMIVEGSRYLKTYDEHLTLQGLQMIWERNHPEAPQSE
uniref:Type III pantothenate kinase n=1 Tax=Solibacter usitatus (strain Ellin6076) TaxID=234267 RepID=COAX_SOLUE|nr:RecName: Full=Type III pantothenate kinase; AltName: Full=PanK-III; AltName: Full=Pantothenic acid kinase [Candidatus Solibacter usitatus Ellin6076]